LFCKQHVIPTPTHFNFKIIDVETHRYTDGKEKWDTHCLHGSAPPGRAAARGMWQRPVGCVAPWFQDGAHRRGSLNSCWMTIRSRYHLVRPDGESEGESRQKVAMQTPHLKQLKWHHHLFAFQKHYITFPLFSVIKLKQWKNDISKHYGNVSNMTSLLALQEEGVI